MSSPKRFRIVEAKAFAALGALFPGFVLCVLIATGAFGVQHLEERALGHSYVESLVVAILMGIAVRAAWTPSARWRPGIAVSARQLLEIAVALLGASISLGRLAQSGPLLLSLVLTTVAVTLVTSFALSRLLGLSSKLSILIACGNSICGNSAIAAVAPVIGADSDDIAASISFTAILGVGVVLGLPLLLPLLHLSATQYGVLAGLTAYAVPQVLAATIPAGVVSTQIGTLVKLVRVLMLGPVVLTLSLIRRRLCDEPATGHQSPRLSVLRHVPWFITVFLVLATLRSLQFVPDALATQTIDVARLLAVVSMAGLGLGVDLRVLAKVGGKVTGAVTLSLLLLLALSLALIQLIK